MQLGRQDPYVAVFNELVKRVFGDLTVTQIQDLLFFHQHTPLVARRRAMLIISRVRMVSAVFALLTPVWIAVDMLIFSWPLWGELAGLRLAATLAFALLAFGFRTSESIGAAHRALFWLLAVPTLFFLISHPLIGSSNLSGPAAAVATGYAFLPFVMVAGLSVFPITALEGALFAAPMILAQVGVAFYGDMNLFSFSSLLGALWLLLVLATVATLAGMSQLHFMMALVNQASHDGLTSGFTRRVGEELFELQFGHSVRTDTPLSCVFIDLDNFKRVNDRFGHEEGDRILRKASDGIRKCLRRGDVMVRWGGEEFVIIMPHTDCTGALTAAMRMRGHSLGLRPDGEPQTASIGIAERNSDACTDWQHLVETADQRMYAAKQNGRNRICICNGEMISDETPFPGTPGL
ncbi:MAG: GGDEF domain-containing protein [Alphaproteobacteria bacterium]|nr:GGDEF domain-containing protein [Alphaproteobacteria bacterium]